jgi:hypothetical protein
MIDWIVFSLIILVMLFFAVYSIRQMRKRPKGEKEGWVWSVLELCDYLDL